MIKTLSNLLKQDKDKFTKSFKFTDINYAVARRADEEGMILGYSELLNSFDSGATTKITVNNRNLNSTDFERNYKMGYARQFICSSSGG